MGNLTIRKPFLRRFTRLATLFTVLSLLTLYLLLSFRHASATATCPCHISDTSTPTGYSVFNDSQGLELGVRFKPQVDGYITGVRFYKDASMTDSHIGSLWDKDGNLLATGTFTNETSQGWQELSFTSAVPVSANTLYTASYSTSVGKYIASNNFYTSDINNYPLIAPSAGNAIDGKGGRGNGVYSATPGAYPTSTYNATNYWVDATFVSRNTTMAPAVTSMNPANGSTTAYLGQPIRITFNVDLSPQSVTSSTILLTDSIGSSIASVISYDPASRTATLKPNSMLSDHTLYKVTIKSGVSGVVSLDGVARGSDITSSFTTNDTCPCSPWENAATPSGADISTETSVELGQAIRSDSDGYLSAIRFYKNLKNTATTHTLKLWSSTGTLLGSATTANETSAGWQEASFMTPIHIDAETSYIISYDASDGIYVHADNLTRDMTAGPMHIVANGSSFHYGAGVFPDSKGSIDYVLDPIFTATATYQKPLTVMSAQPVSASYGVSTKAPVTVMMSQSIDRATLTSSVKLTDANTGLPVNGTASFDDDTRSILFTPAMPLANETSYTLTIATSLTGISGAHLIKPYTLSFTTGSSLLHNINTGLGGPILIICNNSNPYTNYLAEILRTEGINYFDVRDISQTSSSLLANYQYVLLGSTTLTADQASTVRAWTAAGGNLIAFRPDSQLADVFGVQSLGDTLTDAYLKVDTTKAPGLGIFGESMQFHSVADRYNANSATDTVATLYSDSTTSTSSPAVTYRNYGSGHASAFAYDLPRSIALMHQGNPAWVGLSNGAPSTIIRPDSLFHQGSGTDWLNVDKANVPQADEQQRLLANIIVKMSADSGPLPHYWYLPHGYKAAVVMAGDDHSTNGGTVGAFATLGLSDIGNCSVIDWTCDRGQSFVYVSGGPSQQQAAAASARGFSMGMHINTDCTSPGTSTIDAKYKSELTSFKNAYPMLVPQRASRIHCYAWTGWSTTAATDAANGIKYDMNYEWYPSSWASTQGGIMTGSLQTMRFVDENGRLIDVYNGATDLDYENDPSATSIDNLLSHATGPQEFYGVVGTHYDYTNEYPNLLINTAHAFHVPMISSEQMATWKDAQSNSTFTILSHSANKVTFVPHVAEGGSGAKVLLPSSSSNGKLVGLIYSDGSAVTYTTSVIKGVEYVVFDGNPNIYTALYGTQPVGQPTAGKGATSATHPQYVPAPNSTQSDQIENATQEQSLAQKYATIQSAPNHGTQVHSSNSPLVERIIAIAKTVAIVAVPVAGGAILIRLRWK